MSRMIGYLISPTVSSKSGTGPTLIIWWTAGVSGMAAPAIAPMRGLQTPQAMTTMSASKSPLSVRTRVIAAVLDVEPGDLRHRRQPQGTHRLGALAHDRAGAERVDHADARASRSRRG